MGKNVRRVSTREPKLENVCPAQSPRAAPNIFRHIRVAWLADPPRCGRTRWQQRAVNPRLSIILAVAADWPETRLCAIRLHGALESRSARMCTCCRPFQRQRSTPTPSQQQGCHFPSGTQQEGVYENWIKACVNPPTTREKTTLKVRIGNECL